MSLATGNMYRGPPPTFKKDPQGIRDAKLRSDKEKPFNPLVICGPDCAGKVILFP
jgi:hypothetical protein